MGVKEVTITLSCEGLTSASLPWGLWGGSTRLSAQPTPAPWQLAEVQKHEVCMGTAHPAGLCCADGQDVHLAQTAVAHEGLRHISSPLTVLLFRLDAKEAKYHQG